MSTTAPTPCSSGSTLPPSNNFSSSSTLSFQPCAPQLELLTSSSSTLTSDQLLYLYSRFDLLLLILNVTLIILPLCKYLFLTVASRLSFMKCIHKQIATWKSVSSNNSSAGAGTVTYSYHRHTKLNHITPAQKSAGGKSAYKSVTLNDNLNILETDPLTNNNNNNTFSGGGGGGASADVSSSKPIRSCVSRRLSNKPPSPSTFGIHDRLGELITQTSYILLFLFYLGYTLELTILFFTRRKGGVEGEEKGVETGPELNNIIGSELATASLTLLIHVLEYGIIYGHLLWLSSSVAPERLPSGASSSVRSQEAHHRYTYMLHSFAFVYNAVQSIVSIAKLVITVLLLRNAASRSAGSLLLQFLKPYLLTGMILLQLYFTGKHLLRLVQIVSAYMQVNLANQCRLRPLTPISFSVLPYI